MTRPPKPPRELTFGIDEAGRGPILGPMALAVVGLDRWSAGVLRRRGLCDSKTFGSTASAQARRAELADEIRVRAGAWALRLVDVAEIDRRTFRGELNVLEREVATALLEQLGATPQDRIIGDGTLLFQPLQARYPRLQALDRAEDAHMSVAAASVLAKVARDRAFEAIAETYRPVFGTLRGGGYVNAATRRFLEAYRARYGELPPEARKSWGARTSP